MSGKLRVGVHTSIAGSLTNAIVEGVSLRCDAVQIFSRNPRGWASRPLPKQETFQFREARLKAGLWPLIIHAVYLINLAAPDPELRQKSVDAFREEIRRALLLEADYLVVHPGSVKTASAEQGIRMCIDSIRKAVGRLKLTRLMILIENTAGQGGQIGRTFNQVGAILDGFDGWPIGCCLDTAHAYAAGYEISTPEGVADTLISLSSTIRLDRLHLIHANDTKIRLGGRVDRHWHIGRGNIGLTGFRSITTHPALAQLPFILETPKMNKEDDRRNIARLHRCRGLGKPHI